MEKRFITMFLVGIMTFSLSACSNKALEEAQTAVDAYNQAAEVFNEQIAAYNNAVQEFASADAELVEAINLAQDAINAGETPYNEETLMSLKYAVSEAVSNRAAVPDSISVYDTLVIDESSQKADLESLTEEANSLAEEIAAYNIPALPEIPDYTEYINGLTEAQSEYEDSVQSLKQVTAPSDEFVIERLQSIETITEIAAVTEDHDPNGKLNKQGGYIGCIYFTDMQVDRSKLYIEEGKDNVIDIGCNGGGAIEIFSTVEDAETRNNYLAAFDGTIFASGGHYIVGTVLVRTSDILTGTQQLELTDAIMEALLYVQH